MCAHIYVSTYIFGDLDLSCLVSFFPAAAKCEPRPVFAWRTQARRDPLKMGRALEARLGCVLETQGSHCSDIVHTGEIGQVTLSFSVNISDNSKDMEPM